MIDSRKNIAADMAARHQQRVAEFDKCLGSEVIDLDQLRELSYRGIPEGGGRRGTAWRILLGYLPLKRRLWGEVCQEKRNLYRQLVEEMILSNPEASSPVLEDHPLNPNPASQWQSFFKVPCTLVYKVTVKCQQLTTSLCRTMTCCCRLTRM